MDNQLIGGKIELIQQYRALLLMARVDNVPELISDKLDAWCKSNNIQGHSILSAGETNKERMF
jgi:hypothetical protein